DRTGEMLNNDDPRLVRLRDQIPSIPRVHAVSRLGWTAQHDTFMYGKHPLRTAGDPKRIVFFVEGSAAIGALTSLERKGTGRRHYRYLHKLWQKRMGRLVLALAAASPILELVGAPTTVLHLAGPSGIGKTCLCRLAIAVYGDPGGSLLRFDMTKD